MNGLHTAIDISAMGRRSYKELITYIKDRPVHNRRYAINWDKIKMKLGWSARYHFKMALKLTLNWCLENMEWVEGIGGEDYNVDRETLPCQSKRSK